MTKSLAAFIQEVEDAWLHLRRHLKLCDHFALVFIFSDYPLVRRAFRKRLAWLYRVIICDMEIPLPEEPDRLVLELLWHLLARVRALKAPYWLDLSDKLGEDWEKARINFLLRLNERREPLRRGLNQPLIMVLPIADRARIWSIAPDLWSIRHFTITIGPRIEEPPTEQITNYPPERACEYDENDLAILYEWQRVKGKKSTDRGTFLAGTRAYQVYSDLQRYDLALETATSLLNFAKTQIEEKGETPQNLRDLSEALNNIGDTDFALDALAAARRSYEEGLRVTRKIIECFGETPESLRDLSVSLNKVGNVALALGVLTEARQSYEEGLGIRRKIIKRFGETLHSLRDLSVSLDKMGNTAFADGVLATARQSYEESLDIRRKIIERFGETPESLRALSISLNKMGDTARAHGTMPEARQSYKEGLDIRRKIIEQFGETTKSLRDLSVSLNKLGDTACALGGLGEAQRSYEESKDIHWEIIYRTGETSESLRDLAVSFGKMGEVAEDQGELDAARIYYKESCDIYRKIIKRFDEMPQARRNLAKIEDAIKRLDK